MPPKKRKNNTEASKAGSTNDDQEGSASIPPKIRKGKKKTAKPTTSTKPTKPRPTAAQHKNTAIDTTTSEDESDKKAAEQKSKQKVISKPTESQSSTSGEKQQPKLKGPAFKIKKLSTKQYAKWKPMKKETEDYLKNMFQTNTNLLLSSMPSEESREKCQELLNTMTTDFMDALKDTKFPKPAIVDFKQLNEKTTELENRLSMSTDLYERIQETYEEYEELVEKLEKEEERLEDELEHENVPIAQLTNLNPVLREVLTEPDIIPNMMLLDDKSSPTYVNHSKAASAKIYGDLGQRCAEISDYLPL